MRERFLGVIGTSEKGEDQGDDGLATSGMLSQIAAKNVVDVAIVLGVVVGSHGYAQRKCLAERRGGVEGVVAVMGLE